MKSGITRYTLGGFNQSALDDVYNKAKEIYVDELEPPASGIIQNSAELIYSDSVGINDLYPSGKPTSFSQFYEAYVGPLKTEVEEWTHSNFWWETDLQIPDPIGCSVGTTSAVNTCVEVGEGHLFWLDDEGRPDQPETWVWKTIVQGESAFTAGDVNYSGRACNTAPFEAERAKLPSDYNSWPAETSIGEGHLNIKRLSNSNILVNAVSGYRNHTWISNKGPIDINTIQCSYGTFWFRLVLIDPTGPDDRHLYKQLVHCSSDIRNAEGVFPPGYQGWNVGALNRYKLIPQNGDWMPSNFICFRRDEAYGADDQQTTLARIQSVNPPIVMAPNP